MHPLLGLRESGCIVLVQPQGQAYVLPPLHRERDHALIVTKARIALEVCEQFGKSSVDLLGMWRIAT
jgi:hypothetical protein